MNHVYLLTEFKSEDDFKSTAFLTKERAIQHINVNYPAYRLYATSLQDIEYWATISNQGILLEKIEVRL